MTDPSTKKISIISHWCPTAFAAVYQCYFCIFLISKTDIIAARFMKYKMQADCHIHVFKKNCLNVAWYRTKTFSLFSEPYELTTQYRCTILLMQRKLNFIMDDGVWLTCCMPMTLFRPLESCMRRLDAGFPSSSRSTVPPTIRDMALILNVAQNMLRTCEDNLKTC